MKMPVCLREPFSNQELTLMIFSVPVGDLVSDVLRRHFLLRRRRTCGCCLVFQLF